MRDPFFNDSYWKHSVLVHVWGVGVGTDTSTVIYHTAWRQITHLLGDA